MDNVKSPPFLLALFSDWFDPCPLNPSEDGLIIPWKNHTYCNPPWSNPEPWIDKAIEETKKGYTIALFLRADASTEWYRKLQRAGAAIFYYSGRVYLPNRFNDATMLVILTKSVFD